MSGLRLQIPSMPGQIPGASVWGAADAIVPLCATRLAHATPSRRAPWPRDNARLIGTPGRDCG